MSAFPPLHHLLLRPRLPLSLQPFAPLVRPSAAVPIRRLRLRLLSSYSSSTATQDNADDVAEPAPLATGKETSVVDVNPPRGTRDFPPEDMRLRNWLFQNFREVSRLLSFEEVDFPVVESEALFIRKAGEEITQQMP
ncbi:putative Histidine--tRNA ligase, chloroplastic/mitochondrial [Cocos nucifera]|uniref:histidine--tRNA ligase n=1 Tax=Cocos nucifera TaxID=13894 RepID=A0A8K0N876_COCNU|nr:putative Histidine--tRNA ligase, chloroplastic/mitochondrial [Cocos nucifera]